MRRASSRVTGGSLSSHTRSLIRILSCFLEKVDYEIAESCLTVQRETGSAPAVFAYPNGGVTDFDERARAAVRRRGVRWALSTTNGFADRFRPARAASHQVASQRSFAVFRLKLAGLEMRRNPFRASRNRPAARNEAEVPDRQDAHGHVA